MAESREREWTQHSLHLTCIRALEVRAHDDRAYIYIYIYIYIQALLKGIPMCQCYALSSYALTCALLNAGGRGAWLPRVCDLCRPLRAQLMRQGSGDSGVWTRGYSLSEGMELHRAKGSPEIPSSFSARGSSLLHVNSYYLKQTYSQVSRLRTAKFQSQGSKSQRTCIIRSQTRPFKARSSQGPGLDIFQIELFWKWLCRGHVP